MKNRIISALLLLLVCVPVLIKGDYFFICLVLIIGLLSFKELFDLRLNNKAIPWLIYALAFLATGFLILNNYTGKELTIVLDYRILSFMMFTFLVPMVIINDNDKYNLMDAVYLLGSVLFIGFSFNLMILLRNYSFTHFIYYILIAIFTDTFALFAGKLIGKRKLASKISPNKTVAGFVVGTLMGTIVGVIYYLTVIDQSFSLLNITIATFTLAVMGEIGDLVFSQMKRFYEKKDFSNIIPGHGGFLDIFDSLIFIILTAILFINII